MIATSPQRRPATSRPRRRAVAFLLTGLLAVILVAPGAVAGAAQAPASASPSAAPATTSTASAMAADLLSWINRDRARAGLRALRTWNTMVSLANVRSANMANITTLSHVAAGGDPGSALSNSGIGWYSYGEIIGETSYSWGVQAAANLYSMWKASPVHHAIMFSNRYNYIGVGIARASDGTTYSSILFSESADHTRPSAHITSLTRSGTAVRLAWSGYDALLQTHTAGVRSFNVMYHIDRGPWHVIRSNTTGRAMWLLRRPHGHYYGFRVQVSDRRGNLSAWTPERRIWVP